MMAPHPEKSPLVDEYIAACPADIRAALETVRRAIGEAVPQAMETISYRMPAFKLKGKPVAYFGAHPHHIGFYPTAAPIEELAAELTGYKTSRGAVQLPLDQPIPIGLITRLVQARVRAITGNKS